MRSLKNKPQVESPSPRYPEGRIKDDDGTGTVGTPVNENVYGDFHQFFARLLVEAGITPNEISENAYDGFQTIDALKNIAGDLNIPYISASSVGITYPGSIASAGANFGIRKTVRNTLKMQGIINAPGNSFSFSTNLVLLPIGYRPSIERWKVVSVGQAAGSNFCATMQIKPDGNIVFSQNPIGVTFSGGTLSFYVDIEIDL